MSLCTARHEGKWKTTGLRCVTPRCSAPAQASSQRLASKLHHTALHFEWRISIGPGLEASAFFSDASLWSADKPKVQCADAGRERQSRQSSPSALSPSPVPLRLRFRIQIVPPSSSWLRGELTDARSRIRTFPPKNDTNFALSRPRTIPTPHFPAQERYPTPHFPAQARSQNPHFRAQAGTSFFSRMLGRAPPRFRDEGDASCVSRTSNFWEAALNGGNGRGTGRGCDTNWIRGTDGIPGQPDSRFLHVRTRGGGYVRSAGLGYCAREHRTMRRISSRCGG